MERGSSGDQSHAMTTESSSKSVEIKIKTLDSAVFNCNVDRNISVPALKERVAELTGVPAENQRLICRGKVLKDDHTLSVYNVEDGHTLHLVTRQAPQPGAPSSSAGGNLAEEEQGGDDPSNNGTRNRPTQIAHSVVMGTFNVPDNGDGGMPDVNRIISSVLQSLGITNMPPNAGVNMAIPAVNPAVVAGVPTAGVQDAGAGGVRQTNSNQPPSLERNVGQGTFPPHGIFPAFGQQLRLLQQAMVIPDALTTIVQYLDGVEQALATNGSLAGHPSATSEAAPSSRTDPQPTGPPIVIRGHPTPANLGAVIRRTLGIINGQASLEFNRLASQLEGEQNLTQSIADTGARGELQSAALWDGVLLQHLGALLLELGRATLTLRVGVSASESAINPGPAVFISPAGPNPMMVQPLPFQAGAGFGTINAGTYHNVGTMGFGEIPRNVSIHIHANDAAAIPGFPAAGLATGNAGAASHVNTVTPPGAPGTGTTTTTSVHAMPVPVPVQVSGPTPLNEQPGIRVVPMRTVVAAVPASLQGRPLLDNTGVHPNILHPLLARFQQLSSQHGTNGPPGTTPTTPGVQPPVNGAQQVPNAGAPTIRAQLQVQAWVPDGQGGSRLVTNEEALRTLLNPTQVSSMITPPQQPTQVPPHNNGTGSHTNIAVDTSNLSSGGAVDNQPALLSQQVSNVVVQEPVGDTPIVSRELPSQAELDMNENIGSDQIETTRAGSSLQDDTDVEVKSKDATTPNIPAGLGLTGLRPLPSRIPKRPGRQQQPLQAACTSSQIVQNQEAPANDPAGPVSTSGAERTLNTSSVPDSRNSPSQALPLFQLLNPASSQRGGGGGFDIGSLVSQFAANAGGTTASTRGNDQGQGMGLPAGALGNLMGQVMQNPFMRNVVQQVVEQVGEGTLDHEDSAASIGITQGANTQGGLDFSRLLQDMMPVVSQAINRVGSTTGSEGSNARHFGDGGVRLGQAGFPDILSNGFSEPNGPNLSAVFQQMMPVVAQALGGAFTRREEQASREVNMNFGLEEHGDMQPSTLEEEAPPREEAQNDQLEPSSSEGGESAPVAKRQKIDVEKALEKLEQGSSPDEIFRVIAESASRLMTPVYTDEANLSYVAQQLSGDDALAEDYMALLLTDLTSGREDA